MRRWIFPIHLSGFKHAEEPARRTLYPCLQQVGRSQQSDCEGYCCPGASHVGQRTFVLQWHMYRCRHLLHRLPDHLGRGDISNPQRWINGFILFSLSALNREFSGEGHRWRRESTAWWSSCGPRTRSHARYIWGNRPRIWLLACVVCTARSLTIVGSNHAGSGLLSPHYKG